MEMNIQYKIKKKKATFFLGISYETFSVTFWRAVSEVGVLPFK